jgi:hypothetical protein
MDAARRDFQKNVEAPDFSRGSELFRARDDALVLLLGFSPSSNVNRYRGIRCYPPRLNSTALFSSPP